MMGPHGNSLLFLPQVTKTVAAFIFLELLPPQDTLKITCTRMQKKMNCNAACQHC